MTKPVSLQWTSACLTDVGKVRKVNEDACVVLPEVGLWAVADGMGGHHAGDLASSMIVEGMQKVQSHERFSELVDDVEDRLLEVNRSLLQEAQSTKPPRTIGSTVVAMAAMDTRCVFVWAGDSRAYRYREGVIHQITRDHSYVEDMVQRGELKEEEAETHPSANIITRAVGAASELYLDMDMDEVQTGDCYLLCSDGLYKELNKEEIASHLAQGSSESMCRKLVDSALARGARDNVTVAIIQIKAVV